MTTRRPTRRQLGGAALTVALAAAAYTGGGALLGPRRVAVPVGPGRTSSPAGPGSEPAAASVASATGSSVPHTYAFLQSYGGRQYVVLADGSGRPRTVLSAHAATGRPSVARAGSPVVFAGPLGDGTLGRWGLFRVNYDNSGLRQLSAPQFADQDPSVAPNGRSIAFTRDLTGSGYPRGGGNAIAVMAPDGSGVRLVPGTGGGIGPAYAPDSVRIAYDAPDGLRVVDALGRGNALLYRGNVGDIAWSPDGRRIAFVRHVAEGLDQLVEVGAGGGGPVLVASPGTIVDGPAFSPDGVTVSYVAARGEGEDGRYFSRVYRVRPGTSPAAVFQPARVLSHLTAWSPPAPAPPVPPPPALVARAWTTSLRADYRAVVAPGTAAFVPLSLQSYAPPAVASAGGRAYDVLDYHGALVSSVDGAHWAAAVPAGTRCGRPAAAMLGTRLYVACVSPSRQVFAASVVVTGRAPVLPALTPLGGTATSGPAVAFPGGIPTFVVVGTNGRLYRRTTGSAWLPLPVTCRGTPAAGTGAALTWLGCATPSGTLAYAHQVGGGPVSSFAASGAAITGGVGVAVAPDGTARFAVLRTSGAVWTLSLRASGSVWAGLAAGPFRAAVSAAELTTR